MAILRSPRYSITIARRATPVLAVLLVLFIVPVMAIGTTSEAVALAGDPAVKPEAEKDAKCLKCHSRDKTKTLEDGEEMSLQVPLFEYTSSAHSKEGCSSCHKVIANKKHPAKKYRISISSQRDYSVEQNEVCRDCHEEVFTQYEGSIHATLVSLGSGTAPVCSDCHTPHAVEPVTGLPCKNCHEGTGLAHEQWLPNTERHLKVVSCAACHAPDLDRRINLELHDNLIQAGQNQAAQNPAYEKLQQQLRSIDEAGDSVDPAEFRNLLNGNGAEGKGSDVTLRVRMEVSSGVGAHRLAEKSLAVRGCNSCHQKGAEVFQTVTVSITSPDGGRLHYTADKEILDSLESVYSVSDFYTIGGTRIPLLDVLVALSLFAGIAIPAGHFTLGRILKRKAAKENNDV